MNFFSKFSLGNRVVFVFLMVILFSAHYLSSEIEPPITIEPAAALDAKEMQISAQGKAIVRPKADIMRVNLTLFATGPNAQEAAEKLKKAEGSFYSMFQGDNSGIKVEETKYTIEALWQSSNSYKYPSPSSYKAAKQIVLEGIQGVQGDSLLEQLLGLTAVENLSYESYYTNLEEYKELLLQEALKDAKERAKTLAKINGKVLGDLVSISSTPIKNLSQSGSNDKSPLELQVTVNYRLKNQ